jgi:hypothetical protein
MMTLVTRVSDVPAVTFYFSFTMVTNTTIDLLITMMTLVTRVSDVPLVTFAFRFTMATNITIYFLVTMMTLITRVSNIPVVTFSTSIAEVITVYWLLFLRETFRGVSLCERNLSHSFSKSNRPTQH